MGASHCLCVCVCVCVTYEHVHRINVMYKYPHSLFVYDHMFQCRPPLYLYILPLHPPRHDLQPGSFKGCVRTSRAVPMSPVEVYDTGGGGGPGLDRALYSRLWPRAYSPAKIPSTCDLYSNRAAWLAAAPTGTRGDEMREAARWKYNTGHMFSRVSRGKCLPLHAAVLRMIRLVQLICYFFISAACFFFFFF